MRQLSRLPPVTTYLLWTIGIVFLLQWLLPQRITDWFLLWPIITDQPTSGFMPWQLLTHALMHGGVGHLLFNALGIFQFGAVLEMTWGSKRYVQFLVVCALGAGLVQLLVATLALQQGYLITSLGISGVVYGLLVAYAMYFPHQRMMLMLPPIELSARTLAIVFGVLALVMGVTGSQQGVAHFAHLGGLAAGWLMVRYWRGQPPFRRKPPSPPKRPTHLRSV